MPFVQFKNICKHQIGIKIIELVRFVMLSTYLVSILIMPMQKTQKFPFEEIQIFGQPKSKF